MAKNDFITRLAKKHCITKKEAKALYDDFIAVLSEMLIETGKVNLSRFATFRVKDVSEKTLVCNAGSRKGEKYVVPAKKKIRARISPIIKKKVNKIVAK